MSNLLLLMILEFHSFDIFWEGNLIFYFLWYGKVSLSEIHQPPDYNYVTVMIFLPCLNLTNFTLFMSTLFLCENDILLHLLFGLTDILVICWLCDIICGNLKCSLAIHKGTDLEGQTCSLFKLVIKSLMLTTYNSHFDWTYYHLVVPLWGTRHKYPTMHLVLLVMVAMEIAHSWYCL